MSQEELNPQDIYNELYALVENREIFKAKSLLAEYQPADLARILSEFTDPAVQAVLFRILPKDDSAEVFSLMNPETQQELLSHLADTRLSKLLEDLAPDDRTALFEELPSNVSRRLLRLMTPETRSVLVELLNYPEDSAGRLMTPQFIDLREDMKVGDALKRIRARGIESETVYTLYVTTLDKRLKGVVSLKDLVLTDPDTKISEIMNEDILSAKTMDDQEDIARMIERYDLLALPIVDQTNRLVGIVTVDDVVDILQEEATEDVHRMGGMEPTEGNYLDTTVWKFFKKRAGWLIILFVQGLLTVTILEHYDATLKQIVALVAFIPLIISSGGNTGSQSATLITRALALGEVEWRNTLKVMKKELWIGLSLGAILGILGFARVLLGGEARYVASIVSITLFSVVLIGALTGALIPLVLEKLGFDPAVSSSPFIASIIDVFGIMIYCNVALFFMGL
jgi:magnesium transporter